MPKLSLVFEKKILIPNVFEPLSECCLALDRQQHKSFLLYLEHSYFNDDPFMISLYQRIINAKKRKSSSIRAKRILNEWEALTKKKLTLSDLKKRVKRLYDLILQFVAQDYLIKEEAERLKVLQKALSNKGAPMALQQIIEQRKKITDSATVGLQKINDQFWLFYDSYYELDTNYAKDGLQLVIELEQYRVRLSETLESMLLCEKTNLLSASTEQDNYSENQQLPPLEVDLKKLFQMARRLHLSPDGFSQPELDEFGNLLLSIHENLAPPVRLLLCKNIINVLSIAISLGEDKLRYQLLKWLKRKVEWGIQPVRYVPANSFINIVLTACGCGDFAYAIWYLQEYGSKTTAQARHLSDAYYDFFKGDYHKTILGLEEQFPRFSVSQLSYTLRTKTLLLRACLANEIKYGEGFEKFLSVRDDFRVFIKRKEVKLPQKQYKAYSNFLRMASEVLNADASSYDFATPEIHRQHIQNLKEKIQATQPLLCKGWLLGITQSL